MQVSTADVQLSIIRLDWLLAATIIGQLERNSFTCSSVKVSLNWASLSFSGVKNAGCVLTW